MLNPFTKTRRIVYLKILILFLNQDTNKRRLFNKRFEVFLLNLHKTQNIIFHTGQVTDSPRGVSVKPYVELAIELRILLLEDGTYILNKIFTDYSSRCNHKLHLDEEDQSFFQNLLFKYDSVPLLLFIELLHSKGSMLLKEFTVSFVDFIIESKIRGKIGEEYFTKIALMTKNDFNQASFYIPRLHWLSDLELINLSLIENKNYQLAITRKGKELFSNVP